MTKNGKLKSADLRDELIRVDAAITACKTDEAEAHAEIKSLARAAIHPDAKDALAKCRAAETRLGHARMTAKRLHDARAEVEGELCLALAKEDQERREGDAAEAKAFAIRLGSLLAEVDARLAEFRRAFTTCVATVREGRLRGWNLPSEELMQAKLNRALRTQFTVDELRGFDLPPLPAPERCTFASIGEAYARGIQGGALHLVKPPAPPPQPIQQAAKSDEGKLPPQGDVGMRFKDDPKEFEVRIPIAR
jgi:hypothetical protein